MTPQETNTQSTSDPNNPNTQGEGSSSGASGQSAGAGSTDYSALYAKAQAEKAALEENWNKRYSGVQSLLSKEQEAHKGTKEALSSLTEKATGLEAVVSTTKTEFEKVRADLEAKAKEASDLAVFKARATLIMGKFPDLAPFEAKGLIPAAPEDKLEELFANFRGSLEETGKRAKQEFQSGQTTPPGSNTANNNIISDADKHRLAANAAALKGDRETYDKEFSAYLAASEQKQ